MDLWDLFINTNKERCVSIVQFTVPPSSTQVLYVINYPLIFLVVVIVIVLLYKYMKRRQIKSTMDDSWLENEASNNQ
jgi:hypothetical protein